MKLKRIGEENKFSSLIILLLKGAEEIVTYIEIVFHHLLMLKKQGYMCSYS
jgi:hypothetical protein